MEPHLLEKKILPPIAERERSRVGLLARSGDPAAMEHILCSFYPLIKKALAIFVRRNRWATRHWEDLLQEAIHGVIVGMYRYNPTKGALTTWIFRNAFDALRNTAPDYLSDTHGHIPRHAFNGPQGRKLRVRLLTSQPMRPLQSMDFESEREPDAYEHARDFLWGAQIDVHQTRAEEKELVLRALKRLKSRRMKDVITQRFGLDERAPRTLTEIAKKYDVSRERIRQIEELALRTMGEEDRDLFQDEETACPRTAEPRETDSSYVSQRSSELGPVLSSCAED